MKALVVAPQPFFTPRGTPFSVYYRTLITAEIGNTVDLLTYGEGQNVDIPGARIIRIPHFSFLGNVKVGPSALKLLLDGFMVLWTFALLLRNRYDFVHAHEEAIFFCRFFKPIFKFKLVYDMHSSLPQQLINFQFTQSRFLIALFRKLEDLCLESSDIVITICPDLAEYVTRKMPKTEKHIMIENSIFDPVRVVKGSRNYKSAQKYKQIDPKTLGASDSGKFKQLVVYAGTLEPYQGIDILIKAFRHVMEHAPDAMLLIVGGSDKQVAHYTALANSVGIEKQCSFVGSLPHSAVKHYIRRASALVSPRSDGTNTPLKIYELLASGIPLVATRIFSHTQVLNDHVAFLVDPKPLDMAKGILAALNDSEISRRIALNAVQLYEEKYSRGVYVDKMKLLIERLN